MRTSGIQTMNQRSQQILQRKHLHLFAGLLVGVMLAAAWRLYNRRPRERIPSHEGLDEPDVAAGFNRIARMPHMRLMRWFVAHRAASMTLRGQAADLGCGPGYLVVDLIKQAPELHVTGIDLSHEMLAEAEEYGRRHGAGDHASFRKGDVQQIPFPDDSLDLVVSTLSLHHWMDPVAVLDEVSRVLRPGGSFLIFDLRRDVSAPVWLLMWFATRFVVPSALRRVNEPLGSRDAAYTPQEAVYLAEQSRLPGWRVTRGLLWLTIEGTKGSVS
jgi:ubiquinone/menaquinone biosynthesis C-methylase UbiE